MAEILDAIRRRRAVRVIDPDKVPAKAMLQRADRGGELGAQRHE